MEEAQSTTKIQIKQNGGVERSLLQPVIHLEDDIRACHPMRQLSEFMDQITWTKCLRKSYRISFYSKPLDRNMSKALSRSMNRAFLPANVWHEFYCCVNLTIFDPEAKLLIGRNGSLFTMKQYESLYRPLKDLTNGYSANSKLIDLYLAGLCLFLSFPS